MICWDTFRTKGSRRKKRERQTCAEERRSPIQEAQGTANK